MLKTERIRYEMFLRVRDFGTTYRDLFPESSAGGQAFAQVAQAISEIDWHAQAKLGAARDGVSLIRFRGHLPKGGYDGQNGIKESQQTRATTIL
jgi:hypothetical protein